MDKHLVGNGYTLGLLAQKRFSLEVQTVCEALIVRVEEALDQAGDTNLEARLMLLMARTLHDLLTGRNGGTVYGAERVCVPLRELCYKANEEELIAILRRACGAHTVEMARSTEYGR